MIAGRRVSGREIAARVMVAVVVVAMGCGGARTERPRARWSSDDGERVAAPERCPCGDEATSAPAGDRSVGDAPPTALARRESRTIRIEHAEPGDDVMGVDRAPRARRVGRGRRVDVAFREADLANALRFLASAGGLNLVLTEGLSGTVTVELRRVRALDAIVALAEAHGATVETRDGIVVVRGR